MGWDKKRRGPSSGYFYESVRTPFGVKKVYHGRSTAGKLAAAAVEQRRQTKLHVQSQVSTEREATADADRLAAELSAWAFILSAAWLVLTGHRYRRGEWRRVMAKRKGATDATAGAKPRRRYGTVAGARHMVKMLGVRASQGHPEAVDSIAKWVEVFPELKGEFKALGALADKAEGAWAKAAAFGDPLAETAARDEAAALRAELVGDTPSVLDRVVGSLVAVSHLAHHRAAVMAAQPTEHVGVRAAREKTLSVAQKRLADAVRTFRLLAKKKARGVRPRRKLKIFEPAAG